MLKQLLVACLIVYCSLALITFDVSQNNKYGNVSILSTTCNKDTQIDLYFNSSSKWTCDGEACSFTNLNSSYLKFMDINGNDLVLTLVSAQAVNNTGFVASNIGVSPDYYYLFRFQTAGATNVVYVVVPIVLSASKSTSVIVVQNINDGTFSGFPTPSLSATVPLSAFNFLNLQDFGKFYHVTNSDFTQTILMSTYTYQLPSQLLTVTPLTYSFTPAYTTSGNKLCYASNQVQGLFQEHLRQSWPLWTWIISIIFYWLYYLLADSESHQCYDKHFQQNKMTCWGFYSLHHLGHVQYFSRLTRVSLLYFVFSFQAMILAALYSNLGEKKDPYTNYQMIIWTAAIAFAVSIPLPYVMGGIFLQGIYNKTLQKFQTIKKSRGIMMNKAEQQAIYGQQIDKLQQSLYSYYYIYYILIFAGMVCFWVPAIYMMMYIPRQWFYLHRIWLASLAITFVIDNLIFDPLLSFLLGNTRFYRIRGFFYNFALGQEYKEIEE